MVNTFYSKYTLQYVFLIFFFLNIISVTRDNGRISLLFWNIEYYMKATLQVDTGT